jgi:hypothetical protein
MNKEQLLIEIEALLRNPPTPELFRHPTEDNGSWYGRVAAAIEAWDASKGIMAQRLMDLIHEVGGARRNGEGFFRLKSLLHQARAALIMEITRPSPDACGR